MGKIHEYALYHGKNGRTCLHFACRLHQLGLADDAPGEQGQQLQRQRSASARPRLLDQRQDTTVQGQKCLRVGPGLSLLAGAAIFVAKL